ncbi:hypothetical protein BC936DRAFT_150132 [Jimgerdemannia flammicorona]|uniref:Uncharacterized protein n=1 Tax=Jimgerdemannia flammicorona TaxID=994334 RepID=A0A433CZG8_9FUNG|nr:hypothetical protein BC936DRAFT_150132 [Jimgerdemannia flammicorona]
MLAANSTSSSVWDLCVPILDKWIRSISIDMPEETDWASSVGGSWFLSPARHGAELIVLSSLLGTLLWIFGQKIFQEGNPHSKLLTTFSPPRPPSTTERILVGTLVVSLLVTTVHKIIRGTSIYLLQPCHMSALILIIAMSWPSKASPVPHLLLNIYLHTAWCGLSALAFPDLRDHYLVGETFNFFFGETRGYFRGTAVHDLLASLRRPPALVERGSTVVGHLRVLSRPDPEHYRAAHGREFELSAGAAASSRSLWVLVPYHRVCDWPLHDDVHTLRAVRVGVAIVTEEAGRGAGTRGRKEDSVRKNI